jgi:hypothetical protein
MVTAAAVAIGGRAAGVEVRTLAPGGEAVVDR